MIDLGLLSVSRLGHRREWVTVFTCGCWGRYCTPDCKPDPLWSRKEKRRRFNRLPYTSVQICPRFYATQRTVRLHDELLVVRP